MFLKIDIDGVESQTVTNDWINTNSDISDMNQLETLDWLLETMDKMSDSFIMCCNRDCKEDTTKLDSIIIPGLLLYTHSWTADCFISTVRSPKTEKCKNVNVIHINILIHAYTNPPTHTYTL